MKRQFGLGVVLVILALVFLIGCNGSSSLSTQATQLQTENTQLRSDLAARDVTVSDLNKQVSDKNKEINDLNGTISSKDKQINDLQKQVSDITAQKDANQKTVTDIQAKNDALQKTINDEKVFYDMAKDATPDFYQDPVILSAKLTWSALAKGTISKISTSNSVTTVTVTIKGHEFSFMSYPSVQLGQVVGGYPTSYGPLPSDYLQVNKEIIFVVYYHKGSPTSVSLYYTDIPIVW